MSERTRLDEIVEESPNTGPWRRCLMAIAERSFRHGVEQCNEMARRIRDGINWGRWDIVGEESVQPAPASTQTPGTPSPGSAADYKDPPVGGPYPTECCWASEEKHHRPHCEMSEPRSPAWMHFGCSCDWPKCPTCGKFGCWTHLPGVIPIPDRRKGQRRKGEE